MSFLREMIDIHDTYESEKLQENNEIDIEGAGIFHRVYA